jgi:hypothetical protein
LANELEVGAHGLALNHEAVVTDASDDVCDAAMIDDDGQADVRAVEREMLAGPIESSIGGRLEQEDRSVVRDQEVRPENVIVGERSAADHSAFMPVV